MQNSFIYVFSLDHHPRSRQPTVKGRGCKYRVLFLQMPCLCQCFEELGGHHLCSITQEVARGGEPTGWLCISPPGHHQHAARVLKTAQSSVCQRVIYDVSLELLTGIFHSGRLSTFSSSYRRALLSLSSSNNHFQTPCNLHRGPSLMPSSWGKAVLCGHGR